MDSLPCAPRSPGTLRRSGPVLQEPPGLPAYRPFCLPAYRPTGLQAFQAFQKYGKGGAHRRSIERDGVNRRNGAFVAAKRAVIGCEVRRVGAEPGRWQKWGAGKRNKRAFGGWLLAQVAWPRVELAIPDDSLLHLVPRLVLVERVFIFVISIDIEDVEHLRPAERVAPRRDGGCGPDGLARTWGRIPR